MEKQSTGNVAGDTSGELPTTRMDPELKAKWIAALRSGEYDKSTKELRNKNGFCCLGVLCDVIDPSQWVPFGDAAFFGWGPKKQWAYLPVDVRAMTGMALRDMIEADSRTDPERLVHVETDLANALLRELGEL